MRKYLLSALLLCFGFGSQILHAQCLALSDLLAIGAESTALNAPRVVTQHLTFEWSYNGPTATSRETFWTFAAPDGKSLPISRLMVRAQRPGQDVVLKTTDASCIRQLRSDLKAKKLTGQPVTCVNCEAVRYTSPEFDATLYSQMKGDYPFVVVVHQVPVMIPGPAAKEGGIK